MIKLSKTYDPGNLPSLEECNKVKELERQTRKYNNGLALCLTLCTMVMLGVLIL